MISVCLKKNIQNKLFDIRSKFQDFKKSLKFISKLPLSLDIYFNEEKYPFLKKVFDSDFNDYQKYRVKIFEVNYNKLE